MLVCHDRAHLRHFPARRSSPPSNFVISHAHFTMYNPNLPIHDTRCMIQPTRHQLPPGVACFYPGTSLPNIRTRSMSATQDDSLHPFGMHSIELLGCSVRMFIRSHSLTHNHCSTYRPPSAALLTSTDASRRVIDSVKRTNALAQSIPFSEDPLLFWRFSIAKPTPLPPPGVFTVDYLFGRIFTRHSITSLAMSLNVALSLLEPRCPSRRIRVCTSRLSFPGLQQLAHFGPRDF